MVATDSLGTGLAVDQRQLARLAHVVDRLLAGRPILTGGARHQRHRPGHGTEFLDFQRYEPGGDLQAIDWRASARSRNLLIRRRLDESAADWCICLDRSASMAVADARKWVMAVQLASAFLYALLHRNNRVAILAFSSAIDAYCPPGRGRAQYGRAVSLLARVAPRRQGGSSDLAACAQKLDRRKSIIVISDCLATDAMTSGLGRLLALGGEVHVLQIATQAELQLDFEGAVVVKDIESGEEVPIVAERARSCGYDNLQSLQRQLAVFCHRSGIALTSCDTDESWGDVVVRHLTSHRGRNA